MTGECFKHIRTRSGYSADEFVEYLEKEKGIERTSRAVYWWEDREKVPERYVDALRAFIGKQTFEKLEQEYHQENPERTVPE